MQSDMLSKETLRDYNVEVLHCSPIMESSRSNARDGDGERREEAAGAAAASFDCKYECEKHNNIHVVCCCA